MTSRNTIIASAAAGGGIVGAVVAVAGKDPEVERQGNVAAEVREIATSKYRFTRANGLDPAQAVEVVRTRSGVTGRVITGVDDGEPVICGIFDDGAEVCGTERSVNMGREVKLRAGCPADGPGRMRIFGLVPGEVQQVKIATSRGDVLQADVNGRLFVLEAATPEPGVRLSTYEWASNGSVIRSTSFPFPSACRPAPER
jgi:hypothetical protein